MAFKQAYDKLADILTRRNDELFSGKPRTWALKTGESLKEQIDDTFEREDDNKAWEALFEKKGDKPVSADVSKMAHYSARVAYCAAANRDLRAQYAVGTGCSTESVGSHRADAYTQSRGALKGLSRFKDINDRRETKISKPAPAA